MGQCMGSSDKEVKKSGGSFLLGRGVKKSEFEGLPTVKFFETYELSANVLGSGSFSIVKLAMNRQTQEQFAVKVMDKKGLSSKDLSALYKETAIMKNLDHPNVVKFYDFYEDDISLYLVLQYAPGGDLFDRIVSRPSFTEDDAKTITRTVASALKYCSELGVTHRDIKPDNILLLHKEDDFSKLVVADFGFAIQLEPELKGFELLQTMCGTRAYVAPEVISGRNYNYKCDIWSLGVIVFILLSGYSPFNVNMPELNLYGNDLPENLAQKKNNMLLKLVRKGEWNFIPPQAWKNVSEQAKDFLRHVMHTDVDARFDYNQLLDHEWLRGEKVDDVDIDLEPLKTLNARRKVLAAAKAKQAASAFIKLMSSSKMLAASERIEGSEGDQLDDLEAQIRNKGKNATTKAKRQPPSRGNKSKEPSTVKDMSVGAFVDLMESEDNE